MEDAIDITDMLEFGGLSLVMARRFATKKGEEIYIFDHYPSRSEKNHYKIVSETHNL